MSDNKVEIIYFYSDIYENEKNLSKISRKLSRKRKDIQIRLINIDDPINEGLTELYEVSTVPLLVFLTPKGKIAARRFLQLSDENTLHKIADQINKGELPNPRVEEIKIKVISSLNSVTKRNDLVDLVAEHIETDLFEVYSEPEIYDLVSSHISAINHIISDLKEFKRVLQKNHKQSSKFVI